MTRAWTLAALLSVAACGSTHDCVPVATGDGGSDAQSNCDRAWRCDEGLRELQCTDAGEGGASCACLEEGRVAREYSASSHDLGLCVPLDSFEVACTAHCSCGWTLPHQSDCACP